MSHESLTERASGGEGAQVIREVNRSYCCAEVYGNPPALFTLPNGQTGLVHCPEQYNRLADFNQRSILGATTVR